MTAAAQTPWYVALVALAVAAIGAAALRANRRDGDLEPFARDVTGMGPDEVAAIAGGAHAGRWAKSEPGDIDGAVDRLIGLHEDRWPEGGAA